MITRLCPDPENPTASRREEVAAAYLPTDTDLTAGRLALGSIIDSVAPTDPPLDSAEGALDHLYLWQTFARQHPARAHESVPGQSRRFPQEAGAPYTAAIHHLAPTALKLDTDPTATVQGSVTFRKSLPPDGDSPFGLHLAYLLATTGEVRLDGTAYNIHPRTPQARLLAQLALPQLTEFGPHIGVNFEAHALGSTQVAALARYVQQRIDSRPATATTSQA